MKFTFLGCIFLLYFVSLSEAQGFEGDVDYIVTIVIASIAGGMVVMVLIILLIRCICLKCKKTPVRTMRPRGLPQYDERRVYRLPPPPPYTERNHPSEPPPSYESHLPLPGVTD